MIYDPDLRDNRSSKRARSSNAVASDGAPRGDSHEGGRGEDQREIWVCSETFPTSRLVCDHPKRAAGRDADHGMMRRILPCFTAWRAPFEMRTMRVTAPKSRGA